MDFFLFQFSFQSVSRIFVFSELDTAGLEQTTEPSFTTVQALNQSANAGLNRSSSNPDLSPLLNAHKIITPSIVNVSNLHSNDEDSAFVVKVYRSDQTFKYFPVHKVKFPFFETKRKTPFLSF